MISKFSSVKKALVFSLVMALVLANVSVVAFGYPSMMGRGYRGGNGFNSIQNEQFKYSNNNNLRGGYCFNNQYNSQLTSNAAISSKWSNSWPFGMGFYNQPTGFNPTGMMFGSGHRMMFGGFGNAWYGQNYYEDKDFLTIEELTEKVETYIEQYDANLKIADIFVFSDSEYYYSIIETDTDKGAMELLVNPVTGTVFPEFGPNMMWNTKYGMMSNWFDTEDVKITADEAKEYANQYLDNVGYDYVVEDEYHEFYGYYTFHVAENDETVGMLSVNSNSGQVWYHTWHGTLLEVISEGHHSENDH